MTDYNESGLFDNPAARERLADSLTEAMQHLAEQRRTQAAAEARRELAEETRHLYAAGKATPDALAALRAKFEERMQSARPVVTSGDIEAALPGATAAALARSYRAEMQAAAGKPDQVREVQRKYRAAGVDTDRVSIFGREEHGA